MLKTTTCTALGRARRAMQTTDCWNPGQQMGRRWPIACVALEITQRCNLDCSLCYLSEHSEAIHDMPLEELYRRIDQIRDHYGTGIDVQVTGGDPTLRNHAELIAVVTRLHDQGQRPTLMTNGIKASRSLLKRLATAGLEDVVFHVDTTQQRKGFSNESELNRLRLRYIDNARDLGLSIMFNTTVHGGNFQEITQLVRFFKQHADCIRTVSFQLQADTGRGTQSGRSTCINNHTVWTQIERGLGTPLNRHASQAGHPECSGYGLSLLCTGNALDLFKDTAAVQQLQRLTANLPLQRNNTAKALLAIMRWSLRYPLQAVKTLGWLYRLLHHHWRPLLTSVGNIHSLSFITHNFMHAHSLDATRLQACAFTVMSARGPVSMCEHNARRDDFILAPVQLADGRLWNPLGAAEQGQIVDISALNPIRHGLKHSKGRTRQRLLAARQIPSQSQKSA